MKDRAMNNNNNNDNGHLEIKQPIVVIGVGGAGAKIAVESSKVLGCKCVLISNDKRDLNDDYCSIFIDSKSWINPSSYKLRSYALSSVDMIKSAIEGFKTLIIVANLAGKAGTAVAPLVCKIAKYSSSSSTAISFTIMPFKFEKDRIFQAGISLNRIRDFSDATVVIDNDAFLDNNPELSPEECYEVTNRSLYEIISSISTGYIYSDTNLLCTSKIDSGSAKSSLKESIGMLYENADPTSIKRAMLYVMGGRRVAIGELNSIVTTLQGIFKNEGIAEVAMSVCSSDNIRVNLIAAVGEKTRFDKYDPLGEVIPKENVLDWEDLDSSPDIEMTIPNLE